MDRACNPELLEELLRGRIDSYKPTNIERFETSMSKLSGPMSVLFDDDSEDEGEALTLGDLAAVHDEVVHVQDNRVSGVGMGENGDGFNVAVKARTQVLPASSASNNQKKVKKVSTQDMVRFNGTGVNALDAPKFHPSGACCFPEDGTVQQQDVSTHSSSGKGKEVQRQHDLLGVFANSGNKGVVLQKEYESESEESYYYESEDEFEADTHRGNEHEATGVHLPGMRTGWIYVITCIITLRKYVGQTVQNPSRRFAKHMLGAKDCRVISRAVKKYGRDNFRYEVVAHVPQDQLNQEESKWIQRLNTVVPHGMNLSYGREGPGSVSDETKRLQSQRMKEHNQRQGVRQAKRDVWAAPGFKEARSEERKVIQNLPENVAKRRMKWDAKAFAKLQAIVDPDKRRDFIVKSRRGARSGVLDAIRRGVARDVWGEFYSRWLSDAEWSAWESSMSCNPPRGCPLYTTQ